MGDFGKLKSKGVTQIMRTQWSYLARGIADLRIMPFANLCQEQVDRLRREPPISRSCGDASRAEEQGRTRLRYILWSFFFQVISQGSPRISRKEDNALGLAFPFHTCNPGAFGTAQSFWSRWFELIKIQTNQFLPAKSGGQQGVNNRPISPGTTMRLDRRLLIPCRFGVPTPFHLMKALQAVTHTFQ